MPANGGYTEKQTSSASYVSAGYYNNDEIARPHLPIHINESYHWRLQNDDKRRGRGCWGSTSPDHVKLTGQMGAFSLALTVLAFSAPLTTVSGYIPVALSFGGIASPLAFIIVTAMILIFGVGYVTLNAAVKRPGIFIPLLVLG